MQRILFIFLLKITSQLFSQNKVLTLDGQNDYLNLGNTAGSKLRTIEMWFNPSVTINSSISRFHTLIARNTGILGAADPYEFGIAFNYLFPNQGKLRFFANDNSGNTHNIYSNNNQWIANQWYHVAVVIDPSSGMRMYINGIVQNDTNAYTGDTDTSRFYTAIGRWGDFTGNRYFNGKIDNVKFSSTASYTTNFTPSCGNSLNTADKGYWAFEGNSSTTAIDSSSFQNNASLVNGATKVLATVCNIAVGLGKTKESSIHFDIYPNPAKNRVTVNLETIYPANFSLNLFDITGKLLITESITNKVSELDISNYAKGIYFYQLLSNEKVIKSGKLIKN